MLDFTRRTETEQCMCQGEQLAAKEIPLQATIAKMLECVLAGLLKHGNFVAEVKVRIGSVEPTCKPQIQGNRHSADFRSVVWNGKEYTFSARQAAAVAKLWEAWEDGVPAIGQETLLECIGSDTNRLRNVFSTSDAWGTMIVPGPSKGSYRLADSSDHLPSWNDTQKRNPPLSASQKDILALLAIQKHRMTTSEIVNALKDDHAESTVTKSIQSLRHQNLLTNTTTRDDYGTGYGLPDWSE